MEKLNGCYCQKVIPLAFDESLSYLEKLCKIQNKVNELIDFANGELSDALIKYIEREFNNIMINATYESNTETLILSLDRNE